MTNPSISPARSLWNEALAWSPFAFLVLVIITGLVGVGNLVASERSFNVGANYMSVAIDRSLTSTGLEGVTALVSPGVKGCVARNGNFSGANRGWFDLNEQEALGASTYQKCYVEQLRAVRLLSNPNTVDRALLVIEGQ